jgi:hypothetical protein
MDGKQAPNISNYEENFDMLLILAAILLVDVIVIIIARFTGLFGTMINVWYDKFGLNAVLADVLVIFLGFMLGRWIYTKYIKPRYGWDGWIFTGLMIVIQMVHDLLFYVGVIRPIDKGANAMMDIFKDYAEQGSWKILIADAGMVVGSTAIAMAYKSTSIPVITAITALSAYALPYLLYAKPIEPKIIGGGPISPPM